jgi:hypothetical protein
LISTCSVIAGSGEVGVIFCTPLPSEKRMVSGPGLLLASRMAWRSEPGPPSAVVVTV